MLRHMWKLVWKRKTQNLMLTLEIVLVFAAVFGLAAFGARLAQVYTMPLGFQYQDAWSIDIQRPEGDGGQTEDTKRQILAALQAMPEVEAAAWMTFAPFSYAENTGSVATRDAGTTAQTNMLDVSDDFMRASGLTLVRGRWFQEGDTRPDHQPVVISVSLAKALFGTEDVAGRLITSGRDEKSNFVYAITGVMQDYRAGGDFMMPRHFMLKRADLAKPQHYLNSLVVKLRPGTPRALESSMVQRLKQVRGDWDFNVTPQSLARDSVNRMSLLPLIMLGIVGAFLLAMVGAGLFGVLWQRTARRTGEIGLRRAIGASAGDIYRQIIGEQMLLSTLAMLVAVVLLAQLPLTGAFGSHLNWTVFLSALGVSACVIYLLSFLCALYPGWRASRLQPTEALHYE